MAIATKTQYWSSRMIGDDPTSLDGSFNADFTASSGGGSASGGNWVITDQLLSVTPSIANGTIYAILKYNTTPS